MVGGAADRSLVRLVEVGLAAGLDLRGLLIHPDETPRITWDLQADTLELDGERISPRAVFLRVDVFMGALDPRPVAAYRSEAWHAALLGWARGHPEVRLYNREAIGRAKPEVLLLARQAGLAVPETWISNDAALLQALAAQGGVAKPIAGGGHCRPLAELLPRTPTRDGATAAPATAQERMPGRDVRVYAAGRARFAFELRSRTLDYRLDPEVEISLLPEVPPEIAAPLDRLLARLGLDFAAADFKEDAQGRLRFLEVNNQPMFAAFDGVAGERLSRAILAGLS